VASPLPAPDSCELRDSRTGSVKSRRSRSDAAGALNGSWPTRTMTEREQGIILTPVGGAGPSADGFTSLKERAGSRCGVPGFLQVPVRVSGMPEGGPGSRWSARLGERPSPETAQLGSSHISHALFGASSAAVGSRQAICRRYLSGVQLCPDPTGECPQTSTTMRNVMCTICTWQGS
jgi:hypothetical protein